MATQVDALRVLGDASSRSVTTRLQSSLPAIGEEGQIVYCSAPAGLFQWRSGLWVLIETVNVVANYMIGSYRVNITDTASNQLNPVVMPFEIDMTFGFLSFFLVDNGAVNASLGFDLGYVTPLMIVAGNGVGGLNMTLAQIQAVNCVNIDCLYTLYRSVGGTSRISAREQMQLIIMDPDTGLQVPGTTVFPVCTVYETQPKDQEVSHRNVGVISWQSPPHQPFLSQLTGTRRLAVRIQIDAAQQIGIRTINGLLYFGSVRYSVN